MSGLCLEAFNALFHKVNPLLEAFFQSIVDGEDEVDADAVLEGGQSRRRITMGEITIPHNSNNNNNSSISSTPRHAPLDRESGASATAYCIQPPSAASPSPIDNI